MQRGVTTSQIGITFIQLHNVKLYEASKRCYLFLRHKIISTMSTQLYNIFLALINAAHSRKLVLTCRMYSTYVRESKWCAARIAGA